MHLDNFAKQARRFGQYCYFYHMTSTEKLKLVLVHWRTRIIVCFDKRKFLKFEYLYK